MKLLLALWAAAWAPAWAAWGCVPVEGENILAGDVARLWPAFAAAPADRPVGLAPLAGARRVMGAGELARLAERFGISGAPGQEVCFERSVAPLSSEQVLPAMRAALADRAGLQLEIVELSRYPVPRGELVFAASNLHAPGPAAPPRAPVVWRGEVRYGGNRRFPVWARVIVTAPAKRVRAAVTLPAGLPVRADQLAVETVDAFPEPARVAEDPGQVVGRQPRRTIREGGLVPLRLLAEPFAVKQGEPVRVEVSIGSARLSLTGVAESSASRGQNVAVRNTETHRTFQARVSGENTVTVDLPEGVKP